ncbi:hypothetical protein C8R46DRAFT_1050824 [Mycena filopes]|nr:hypothetical protein C8R46DRAFT_1050824 [Mycena filopes]
MPHHLTLDEIVGIMSPQHHPERLSGEELEHLMANLTTVELQTVLRRLGLDVFARQIPCFIVDVMLAAQQVAREQPPDYDAGVDRVAQEFDATQFFSDALLPSAAPSPPSPASATPFTAPFTPPPFATPRTPSANPRARAPSTPTSASVTPRAPFSTSPRPITTPARTQARSYVVESPTTSGRVVGWFEAGSLTQGVTAASVHRDGGARNPQKPPAKAWAVFYGGTIAVFTEWAATHRSITVHSLAIYSGYRSEAAASAALEYARAKGWTADSTAARDPLPSTFTLPSAYDDNPLNSDPASGGLWYAVCRGIAPGVYRSYLECSLNTSGVKGNLASSFPTREAAEDAFQQAVSAGQVKCLSRTH